MKDEQNTGIQAALAVAAAAFVSIPSGAMAQEASARHARRRRCAPARPRIEAGPYFAMRRTAITRIGAWRPAQGSPCDAGVIIQVFDVETNQVLDTQEATLSDGEGTLFSAEVPAGTLFAIRTEFGPAPRFLKSPGHVSCQDTFPLKLTVQVSSGEIMTHDTFESWPAKWKGFTLDGGGE